MSPAEATAVLLGFPVIGVATFSGFAYLIRDTSISPVEGGIVVVILGLLLLPVVKWMMARQDRQEKRLDIQTDALIAQADRRDQILRDLASSQNETVMVLRRLSKQLADADTARAAALRALNDRIAEAQCRADSTHRPPPPPKRT
jgi:hypothetical protein